MARRTLGRNVKRMVQATTLAAVVWSYDIWSGAFMLYFALPSANLPR